jgi:tetratricopeptide (TPR) repeat protein
MTENNVAYEKFLKGKHLFNKMASLSDVNYAKQLHLEAIELDDEFIEAYVELAITCQRKGNFEEAESNLEEGLEIAEKNRDQQGIAYVYNGMGILYTEWSKYQKAAACFENALKIEVQFENRIVEAKILNSMSSCMYNMGQIDKAFECVNKSLAIKEELEDDETIGLSYGQIANTHFVEGDFAKAIEYGRKALGNFRNIQMVYNEGRILVLLAEWYARVGYWANALKYLQDGISICEEFEDQFVLGKIEFIKGLIESGNKQYALAAESMEEAVGLYELAENREHAMLALQELGIIYIHDACYTKAIRQLKKCIRMKRKLSVEDKSLLAEIALIYAGIMEDDVDEIELKRLTDELITRYEKKVSHREWHYLNLAYLQTDSKKLASTFKKKAKKCLNVEAAQISSPELQKSFIANYSCN